MNPTPVSLERGLRRVQQEHRRLERHAERIYKSFEVRDREAYTTDWPRFEADLLGLLAAEEASLLADLHHVAPRDARCVVEEHRHLRVRLAELSTSVALGIVRLDVARSFIDELRAHARNEDRILYRWVDRLASQDADTERVGHVFPERPLR